ncbi:hypothetical protein JCM10213_004317 [Rhodosporidiobolus nylandii]
MPPSPFPLPPRTHASATPPPVAGPSSFAQPLPTSHLPPSLPHTRYPKSTSKHNLSNLYSDISTANLSTDHIDSLRRQSNFSTLSLSPRRPSLASGSTATARRRPAPGGTPLHFGRTAGGDEDESGFLSANGGGDAEHEWTMVDRMRCWRNDAMTQHLYESARFWGGKVLGMTGNPDDAFWLAQTHFLTHQYSHALRILSSPRPSPSSAPSSAASPHPQPQPRLTDMSLACRYLAAQCLVRLGRWEEGLEMVGRRGGWGLGEEGPGEAGGRGDGGIKLTASASHLRGLIHLHLKATDLAKEAFMDALTRDVKCFEAFEILVGGEMMGAEEEWEFVQSLPFHAQTEEDAEFIRMMYTVRLKKLSHPTDHAIARQRLTDDYGLGSDPDVLFSKADELYAGMRWAECFKVTGRILDLHPSHRPTLPLHLACMHHLPAQRSKLFLLAHELVDAAPDDAVSWYAVGLWYFAGKRWEEARRFFGKSLLLDPLFSPSWLSYAHSFAHEGEHDQAITAYSTAQRHMPGSHLPLLYIGMQHLGLGNTQLADEYVRASYEMCREDPATVNEMGCVAMALGQHDRAVQLFRETLVKAKGMQSSPAAWATTHLNLGHAYRKCGDYDAAYLSFRRVIELEPRHGAAYSGMGIVEHARGRLQEAVARYHEALAIAPADPTTISLLSLALSDLNNQISTRAFPFLGLPPQTLRNIDAQVAALDEEIRAGADLPPEDEDVEDERRGEESAVDGYSVSVSGMRQEDEGEGSMMEGETMEGETMDMTGD